jgi:pSer/pThr/pTyr-binding forkhead associated (FHA) protein
MASLRVHNEAYALRHELIGDLIMIGRAPLNDIVIDNPFVSAQHAMLLKVGDSYWLKDLNSTNGTYINGLPFTYGELKDGDTIRFGSVIAIFAERCRKRWSTCAIRTFWASSTTRRKSAGKGGGTEKMEFDDSSKAKVGRVDHVSLPHQMTPASATQEAMEACSARKAVGEHLLACLDEEIDTCGGRTTYRSALSFWRNKIRNMKHH